MGFFDRLTGRHGQIRKSTLNMAASISRRCADVRARFTKPDSTEVRGDAFITELSTIHYDLLGLVVGEESSILERHLHSSVSENLTEAYTELKLLVDDNPLLAIEADMEDVDAILFTIWHQTQIVRGVLLGENEYAEYRR